MIGRTLTGLLLAVVFLGQVLRSGLATAWLILRPGPPPTPGFVRLSFAGVSPPGAAVLGALITLTPGTTTLDIDLQRGEMLLHLLDASDTGRVAEVIHRQFELPLRRMFPAGVQR